MSPISKLELETFALSANSFFTLNQADQIDFFVYFLTIEKGLGYTQATPIRDCFLSLDLSPYSNISQYLTTNLKSRYKQHPKFIRIKNGYQLHRDRKISIENSLDKNPYKLKVKEDLRALLTHLSNPTENEFLKEAIDCFEIGAYRASTVMVWNLTIDHLYEYVLANELSNFNSVLAKNTDKRIKVTTVVKKDDFTEIPENKFIEFCKGANVITGDIRKILDVKLGIRNTFAHPSSIKMLESKALEFIEDLINNVVLKYSV
jgi:hypothetical protein